MFLGNFIIIYQSFYQISFYHHIDLFIIIYHQFIIIFIIISNQKMIN